MDEIEYRQKLVQLIQLLKDNKITREVFFKRGLKLGKILDREKYKTIRDFKDETLGWAKYWIEESSFYGVNDVLENKFDFFQLISKTKNS